jgi:hypothetical protein
MQGRIGKRTWQEWATGIERNLRKSELGDAWAIVRLCLQPDFQELRLFEVTRFSDPRDWPSCWRRALSRELPVDDRGVRRRARR